MSPQYRASDEFFAEDGHPLNAVEEAIDDDDEDYYDVEANPFYVDDYVSRTPLRNGWGRMQFIHPAAQVGEC